MKKALRKVQASYIERAWLRWGVYACFFLSGATALIFEVIWSREFVTVFGNSSYAISIVLCAYMAGLGLGGWVGGRRLADRMQRRAVTYAATQAAIAVCALGMPFLLQELRIIVPALPALSPDSLFISTLARFIMSLVILVAPCFLIGTTLPLLVRVVTRSDQVIGTRVGSLYCWNTLGAALGCWAAGFWLIETVGLRATNLVAVAVSFAIALVALALSRPLDRLVGSEAAAAQQLKPAQPSAVVETADLVHGRGWLFLVVAFLNGFACLACEVLWIRYLGFLNQEAYLFPTVLLVFLLGLGLGGWIYVLMAKRLASPVRALAIVELLLGLSVLATFVTGALILATGPPPPLGMKSMALVTVSLPAVLMGVAFPLLCSIYGRQVHQLGGRVGLLYAVNTAGTVFGSLLPLFVLVLAVGIQKSLLLVSLLYGGMGLALLAHASVRGKRVLVGAAVIYAVAVFLAAVPPNLCQRVFLASCFNLAKHNDILFYQEGRTGTAVVTRDRANNCKTIYINGVAEVPALYADMLCFKMLGDLGPMLHPLPAEVLMICFGGGIAAGAVTSLPEVKSLTIVDLEKGVVKAAPLLEPENNGLLHNPKTRVVIDDGRNYLMMARRKWPVVISDSTHPKNSDSWVLYTQEFYRLVREHLTDDGVFVEWVPRHGLRPAEFKIIARTFQSVFPHTSLWVNHGMDDRGQFISYTLLVGTARPLSIDVAKLEERLGAGPVRADLEPFGLHTPAGFLDAFICGEDALRSWVGSGPVNTDDLPYTQYETLYAKGVLMDAVDFIEPMEDVWPFLTGVDSALSARQLQTELALRAKANRLAFIGRMPEAYALLPDDPRFREMQRLFESGSGYVQKLLELYWDNPKELVFLANYRASGPGGVMTAKPIYERVLQLDPDNASALNMLGAMRSDMGDLNGADPYLRRAVRLAPGFCAAHYNLGLLLERQKRHAEALEQWRWATMKSDNGTMIDQWGVCLVKEGQVAEGISWFKRAVELQPTCVSARLHLANVLYQMGRKEEALLHLHYVQKMDPENKMLLGLEAKMEGRPLVQSEP